MYRTPVVLLFALAARIAAADEGDASSFDARRYGVTLHGGVATSYGLLGVGLHVAPASWLAFEAGVGFGFTGVQVVGDVHLRVPIGNFAPFVTLGLGQATGAYDTDIGGEGQGVRLDKPLWLNVMAGVEYRWDVGVELRLYAGYGEIVHYTSCRAGYGNPDAACEGGHPGFGLAVGYAF